MANILTATEAKDILRLGATHPAVTLLLPAVDGYLKRATGWDWAADTVIDPVAKAAAQMLLVQWFENPGMAGSDGDLGYGLNNVIGQLQAKALAHHRFQGRDGAGACTVYGVQVGDQVVTLVGLVGATGDQHTLFEEEITVEGEIQQISTGDLSANWYRAKVVPPGES